MNFTYDYEQSFLSNSHKQIHILSYNDYAYRGYVSDYGSMHLTNANLVKEQFRLEEKVSDSDHIEYGSMYASMVEFTVRADTCQQQLNYLKDHKGIKILINFGWNNYMYYDTLFYLGNYVVTDMEYTNGENEVKITAYDPLVLIRDLDIAPWLKSKWGNTSTNANDDKILGDLLLDLFDDLIRGYLWDYNNKPYQDDARMDLLQYTGIEYNYGSVGDLINYDMKVSYPSTVEALSLGDFLKSVAELNGCCLHYVANREYFNSGSSGYNPMHPLGWIEFLSFKTYASPEGQEADHIIYNRYRHRGETKLKNYITPKIKKIRAFNASGEWISTYTKGYKKQNAIYSINDNLFLRDYNRMVQKQTIYNSDELISQVWHYYPGSQMMQGDECKSIQTRLNELGRTPELQVDGKYGIDTANAVKWFQQGYVDPDDPTHTLEDTGEVNEETALALGFMFELGAQYAPGGADTWPQIERVLKYVKNGALMEGSDVLAVQRALNSKGSEYSVVENGIYNTQTRDAVKKWQATINAPKQNGRVADQLTCASLSLTWNPYVKDEETVNAVHSALENIYKNVNDNRYIPFSVKCVGNPCMNVGEKLSVYDQTREQKINKSYCLHRVLSGIQMMVDEIEAKGAEEKETFAVYNSSESGSTTVSGGSGSATGVNVETLMSDGSVYGLDQINFIELVRNLGFRFPNEPTKVKVVEGTDGDMTVKFKWTDPSNITNDKPQKSKWAGTVVVRKAGSAPLHRWDFKKATGGILAEYSGKANKSKYKDTFLVDDGTVLPPRVQGQTYYYGIFPYDENGHYRYTKVIKIGGSDKDDTYVEAYVGSVGGPNRYTSAAINISRYNTSSTYKIVLKSGSIPVSETDGTVFEAPPSAYGKVLVSDEIQRPGNYGIAAFEHLNNGSVVAIAPFPELVYFGNIDPDMIVKIDKEYSVYVVSDEDPTVLTNYSGWQNIVNNKTIDGHAYNNDYLMPYPDNYTTMYYYVWKLASCYNTTGIRALTYDILNGMGSSGSTFRLDYTKMVNKALSIKLKQLYFFSSGVHDYTSVLDWDFIGSPGFALCTLDPNYYNSQCVYAFGMTFRTDRCPVSDGKRIFRGIRTRMGSSGNMQIANAFEYVADNVNPANNIPVKTAYDFEYIINLGTYDSETYAINVNSIVELVDDEVVATYDMSSSGIKIFLGGNGAGMFFLQDGSSATGYGPEGETYGQTWRCEGVEFKYCDAYTPPTPPTPTEPGIYLGATKVCEFSQLSGLNANYSNMMQLAISNGYCDTTSHYSVIFDEPSGSNYEISSSSLSGGATFDTVTIPEGWKYAYAFSAKKLIYPSTMENLGNMGSSVIESIEFPNGNDYYQCVGNILMTKPNDYVRTTNIISVLLTADWDTFNSEIDYDVTITSTAFSRTVPPSGTAMHKPFVWMPNMISSMYCFGSRFEDFKISSSMTKSRYLQCGAATYKFQQATLPFPEWEDGSNTLPIIKTNDFSMATIKHPNGLAADATLDLSGLTNGIENSGFYKATFIGYTKFIIGDQNSNVSCGAIANGAFLQTIINDGLYSKGAVKFVISNAAGIGDSAFWDNVYSSGYRENVREISINNLNGNIGKYAFRGYNKAVFSISVNPSASNLTIGTYAFDNAAINSLDTSITLPSVFSVIGAYAFNNVVHLYYNGSAPGSPWGAKNIN